MFRNIPPIVKNLLIINFIAYLAQLAFEAHGMDLVNVFGLHFILASDFRIWQLFTYMFLHGGTMHILLNMFSLWMFGCQAERDFGSQRFLWFYLACGVGAGLFQEVWQLGEYFILAKDYYIPAEVLNSWATVGASGAVYGVLLSFGMNHPNQKIWLIFPPIPFKAKWFVLFMVVIELAEAFLSTGNVAHFAHLGGMFIGWLLILHWRKQDRQGYNQPSSWGKWDTHKPSVWERIKERFSRTRMNKQTMRDNNPDHLYNESKRQNEERMDQILDKVKRSGYASLTDDEKRELFERSQR
ncbi:MAG: rhomboid family intramembrane serine protease [Bacteroidaceae bacterium]|nr:rhomboid family intramembrane serine protease [Bacteroidaceae bacterium]